MYNEYEFIRLTPTETFILNISANQMHFDINLIVIHSNDIVYRACTESSRKRRVQYFVKYFTKEEITEEFFKSVISAEYLYIYIHRNVFYIVLCTLVVYI